MIYVFVAALVVGAIAWHLSLDRQAAIYEQMLAILERERDQARAEAKLFMGLIVPATKRDEAPTVVKPTSSEPVKSMGRMSFRRRFNLMRREKNTKQNTIDALASRIPSGENHA